MHGADLLSVSLKGNVYKIQLKGRLTFDKKYLKKDLYIACPVDDGFYIYPHDEALKLFLKRFNQTSSWKDKGSYSTTTKYEKMEKYYVDTESKEVNF